MVEVVVVAQAFNPSIWEVGAAGGGGADHY